MTVLSVFCECWVFPMSVIELLDTWYRARMGKRQRKIWSLIRLCLLWTNWRDGRDLEGTSKAIGDPMIGLKVH